MPMAHQMKHIATKQHTMLEQRTTINTLKIIITRCSCNDVTLHCAAHGNKIETR